MRETEELAFNSITPIVQTGSARLDAQRQAHLANFLTLFFMIVDSMDHRTSGVMQSERTHLFEQRIVPSGWALFIGRAATEVFNYRFRHFGGPFTEATAEGSHRSGRLQICTAAIGPLLMHVVSSSLRPPLRDREACVAYADHFGLAAIHPGVRESDFSELPELGDDAINAVAIGSPAQFIASVMPG